MFSVKCLILLQLFFVAQGYQKILEKHPQEDVVNPYEKEPTVYTTKAIVGEKAPPFSGYAIIDSKMTKISLKQYYGKYVVLVFYPLDFTEICTAEIQAFSKRADEFLKHNAQLILCSVDSAPTHAAMVDKAKNGAFRHVKQPLLSDSSHQISKDYGVYIEELDHSQRATFIIDEDGYLRHMSINDLTVTRNVNECLRLVQAFQHADKTHSYCAPDWKPKTDKTNQKKTTKKVDL